MSPVTRAASGEKRPRPQLSQPVIIAAAIELVERDGPGALTLRRLGVALGADHTAVLRHFSGKDELELAMVNRLLEEALAGFRPSAHWRPTLEDLARRFRAAYRRHPGVARFSSARASFRPAEVEAAEIIVAALLAAGCSAQRAADTYRALANAALALSAYDAAAADQGGDGSEELLRLRDAAGAAPETLPALNRVAEHLPGAVRADPFETVLGLLLDGLAAQLPEASSGERRG
ncbi:TetR/AcrR family transcriptional regulator [Leucobacter sp. M11]|uniref:TetR/AcrR family transcriptional regulator n=1 Tax=Leucobacter sp. M11 TaxID=2993565 RepID=UPI002D7F2313|nr:helix-turn-helix domain-containing protein [Leucobacter sp. M11]MEB4614653.1 helix-turn-helix domain containing protein [Leucobacter sp. M11]